MASGLIGIQVPGNRLWVRVPCPPLLLRGVSQCTETLKSFSRSRFLDLGIFSLAVSAIRHCA